MRAFDWHGGTVTADPAVTDNHRNTQNVRRFTTAACGAQFKFDRAFMAWMKDGTPSTMGEAAAEWLTRNS